MIMSGLYGTHQCLGRPLWRDDESLHHEKCCSVNAVIPNASNTLKSCCKRIRCLVKRTLSLVLSLCLCPASLPCSGLLPRESQRLMMLRFHALKTPVTNRVSDKSEQSSDKCSPIQTYIFWWKHVTWTHWVTFVSWHRLGR
jgi:hypothetical protein